MLKVMISSGNYLSSFLDFRSADLLLRADAMRKGAEQIIAVGTHTLTGSNNSPISNFIPIREKTVKVMNEANLAENPYKGLNYIPVKVVPPEAVGSIYYQKPGQIADITISKGWLGTALEKRDAIIAYISAQIDALKKT